MLSVTSASAKKTADAGEFCASACMTWVRRELRDGVRLWLSRDAESEPTLG